MKKIKKALKDLNFSFISNKGKLEVNLKGSYYIYIQKAKTKKALYLTSNILFGVNDKNFECLKKIFENVRRERYLSSLKEYAFRLYCIEELFSENFFVLAHVIMTFDKEIKKKKNYF